MGQKLNATFWYLNLKVFKFPFSTDTNMYYTVFYIFWKQPTSKQ